jgi:autophagy-related protein 18
MSEPCILDMTFSGDGTTLTGSTPDTCFHFSLDVPESPEKLDYGPSLGGTTVARLGRSSLVAFVSIRTPRKLRIMNVSKNTEICSHHYSGSVLGVRLTQLKMIVCLENRIYIQDARTTNVEHMINTSPNPRGLLAVTDGEDDQLLLAFPNSSVKGEVQIFDALSHKMNRVVQAHELPVACLQLNGSGTLLATASVEGYHILVFNLSGK